VKKIGLSRKNIRLTAFCANRCRTETGKLKMPDPPCIDFLPHH
jgi:hypothetical protein